MSTSLKSNKRILLIFIDTMSYLSKLHNKHIPYEAKVFPHTLEVSTLIFDDFIR